MKFRELVKSTGAFLPGIAVAACVAGGLSGYKPPVFEPKLSQVVEAAENDEAEEKKTSDKHPEKKENSQPEKISVSDEVNLADCKDGTYEGSGQGFQNGKTTVKVTVRNHRITAIEVVSHQDTESYFNNAKSIIESVISSQSLEVDAVSGATYSSRGILEAISNALKRAAGQTVSDDYSGNDGAAAGSGGTVNASASSPDNLSDGTYTGSAEGFSGITTVSVTVSGGKITSVDVLSHSDTPSYFSMAAVLCDQIVANNGVNGLDAVSGATYSSRGILQAVANALSGAGTSSSGSSFGSGGAGTGSSDPVTIDVPDTPDTLKDGTYTGSGTGFGGITTLRVTVSGGKITDVQTVSHQDTPSYYSTASVLCDQIVANNGVNGLDAVSGATYSSRGIFQAAADALSKAGVSGTASSSGGSTEQDSSEAQKGSSENKQQTDPAVIDENTAVIRGQYPYPDGVYTGTGEGNGGDITVSIVIRDKTITSAAVLSAEDEDEPFLSKAKTILSDILLQQSTEVDAVSGATYSSEGILDAVKDALSQAAAVVPAKDDSKAEDKKDTENIPDSDTDPHTENPGSSDSKPEDAGGNDGENVPDSEEDVKQESQKYQDGTYTTSLLVDPGEDGDFLPYVLSMEMTIENGMITSFDHVIGSGDGYEEADERYINRALNGTKKLTGIAQQVFDQNAAENVEAVSGATWTSEALLQMIREMLTLAETHE